VDVRTSDQRVTVTPRSRLNVPRSMDLSITVPRWMRLQINGTFLDVRVEGTQGEVVAENVRGLLQVSGGAGYVSLKSVEGPVTLAKATGKISVSSVNEAVRVADCTGDISAETINGHITLENLAASSVDAATVNGRITFSGVVKEGPYRFSTHNGQVVIAIPESSNVTIVGRTYQGRFRSQFSEMTVEGGQSGSARRTLTLGDGRARMEAESFSGSVVVGPPGTTKPGG
jgi:DUF4097 and DUF4098 domain-containing protein YvlB